MYFVTTSVAKPVDLRVLGFCTMNTARSSIIVLLHHFYFIFCDGFEYNHSITRKNYSVL